MTRETIQKRLDYWEGTLGELMDAYLALVKGGVKSYSLSDRELTRLDLPSLKKAINDAETKIAELEALLAGQRPRKAFAVLPRDW